ncbi:autotransporter outer membrane beta-barrel domain-containing protein [Roseomonas acroporae]|uniref:autotransporter outer membrane beta-barrel domain-containing protein n=1 Tax=Roseomonas acroporae TaxID=2937791 RepID=UPI0024A7544D|nr:autotransporter outer membrane beta-barrel domain-containing protein [Roseomonas acroporae]
MFRPLVSHLHPGAAHPHRQTFRALLLGSLAGPALLMAPASAPAFTQDVSGAPGSGGSGDSGSPQYNGNGGLPGNPGGTIGSGAAPLQLQEPAALTANGGDGGRGADSGLGTGATWSNGGNGGAGGRAGGIGLDLSGAVSGAGSPVDLRADGGNGGAGGNRANFGRVGDSGAGGAGGSVTFTQTGGSIDNSAAAALTPAVSIDVRGGNGPDANGLGAQTAWDRAAGPAGGSGGAGGSAGVTLNGTVNAAGSGVVILSQGGTGGTGAAADGPGSAVGGAGGNGGAGGTITVRLGAGASIQGRGASGEATGGTTPLDGGATGQLSVSSAGILAQSLGGVAGQGNLANGGSSTGGAGGNAGAGGAVSVTSNGGSISMSGYSAAGILAQSVGGVAGNGSTAGAFFRARGGLGGAGADGAAVNLSTYDNAAATALILTRGGFSDGLVAQSLGGGGGQGGSVRVSGSLTSIAIGGPGGAAGLGGTVNLWNGQPAGQNTAAMPGAAIWTQGDNSVGLLAQSIGGGGGRGGDAFVVSPGSILGLAIGGSGGAGGTGGGVTAYNTGLVETGGAYSYGIAAQSLGGGGGIGGSASTLMVGSQITASVAIGGAGGSGGRSGAVFVQNTGQIVTLGDHAYGILAQSVSGGGGAGGSATSHDFQVSSGDIPSVNLVMALGGTGAAGGQAGSVTIGNSGGVLTTGDYAHGILAQSISGGGGAGGSAGGSALSVDAPTITVSTTLGGQAGAGGTAGSALIVNSGLVMTLGQGAFGLAAQSIAGGGGVAGASSSNTGNFRNGDLRGLTLTVTTGGAGGAGGAAGQASVINGGGIFTFGDGAAGMLAQSVSGGGGAGGAASGHGSGGLLTLNIGVGGRGGNGNVGGNASASNSGSIITLGGQSPAIHAQSIGGGGGTGGIGATGSGNGPEVAAGNFLAGGLGVSAPVVQRADGLYSISNSWWGDFNVYENLRDLVTGYQTTNSAVPAPAPAENGFNLDFTLNVGGGRSGAGGSGQDGGPVNVVNEGTAITSGPASAGVLAQSIGGGGGAGGAAQSGSFTVNRTRDVVLNAGVGGSQGMGGSGSLGSGAGSFGVSVTSSGIIETSGDLSPGILAQGIGGGGGLAVQTLLRDATSSNASIQIGGSRGASGDGGSISVTLDPAAANNHIQTNGRDAPGIVAQSIGGGGGAVLLLSTPSTGGTAQSGQLPGSTPVALNLGGTNPNGTDPLTSGNGGQVQVQLGQGAAAYGYLQTIGINSHGVLAQSIGGGGGWVAGGNNPSTSSALQTLVGTPGVVQGNGGPVGITVSNGFNIGTYGAGAAGILAQSIGGGGGLFGGLNNSQFVTPGTTTPQASGAGSGRYGQGGDVSVDIIQGGLATFGAYAPVIFAQSLGGGGGVIDQPGATGITFSAGQPYAFCGHGRDGTCTGNVTVTIGGNSLVESLGANSTTIFAQSRGNGVNNVDINVNDGIVRASGKGGIALVMDSMGTANLTVQAAGTIQATGSATSAIVSWGPFTANNAGTVQGQVQSLGNSTFNNLAGGYLNPAGSIYLGTNGILNNAGRLDLTQTAQTTYLTGHLHNTGTIITSTDHAAGVASTLSIVGSAQLGGTIEVRPVSLANRAVTVLTATEGLTVDPNLAATRLHLYTFLPRQQGNDLLIQPQAQFAAQAAGLGVNQRQVADHLQSLWDDGARFDAGFTTLARIADAGAYRTALNSLSGETVSAVSAARLTASRNFVTNLYSCPAYQGLGVVSHEEACSWARVVGNGATQDTSNAALGYSMASQTIQFGGQWALRPDWFLGLSGGYEYGRFSGAEGSSRVTGDNLLMAAVLKHQRGNWLFSAGLDSGYGWYESNRVMSLGDWSGVARGSPTAWHLGINARVSYQIPFETWYLKPTLDLHATHVRSGGYTESGVGPFNLTVDSHSSLAVAATAMLEVGTRFAFSNGGVLRPYARLGITAVGVDGWATTARFARLPTSPGFQTGTPVSGIMGRMAAGVTLTASEHWDVTVQYGADVSAGYLAHTGTARVAYRF